MKKPDFIRCDGTEIRRPQESCLIEYANNLCDFCAHSPVTCGNEAENCAVYAPAEIMEKAFGGRTENERIS